MNNRRIEGLIRRFQSKTLWKWDSVGWSEVSNTVFWEQLKEILPDLILKTNFFPTTIPSWGGLSRWLLSSCASTASCFLIHSFWTCRKKQEWDLSFTGVVWFQRCCSETCNYAFHSMVHCSHFSTYITKHSAALV